MARHAPLDVTRTIQSRRLAFNWLRPFLKVLVAETRRDWSSPGSAENAAAIPGKLHPAEPATVFPCVATFAKFGCLETRSTARTAKFVIAPASYYGLGVPW